MRKPQTNSQTCLDVREISGHSLDNLVTLLGAEGLATEDIGEPRRRFFAFSDTRGTVVGYGGLERAEHDMLLRSVVTAPMHRGAGQGQAITKWLIGEAARSGGGDLYLLTTTAPDFFAKLGFEIIERTSVPRAVAASREFSFLCPSSAVVMRRRLRAPCRGITV
jgi:N-acetylglutamate synthase-like GNAT family acetyltransferase